MVSNKGKEKVVDGGRKGKRKVTGGGDNDKTGRKRANRGVVQFFDDAAYEVDEDEDSSDDSLFNSDDFFEDEYSPQFKSDKYNESAKGPGLPFIKEEVLEEDYDRMMEERYKPGAGFVTHAEDRYDQKSPIDKNNFLYSSKDLIIWKVKCMVGRERYSAFCLMQKFVDMNYLGSKLQIISACAVDHVKGFIFLEAEKQHDIYAACKGISSIYPSRVAAVPNNELSHLLLARSTSSGISEGMWARVKSGKYKGDLAQVVAVNHTRKKVTVKLIPRIDLKAMAAKFGGGVTGRRTDIPIPAQRLISSSELEEFQPLIQSRRDRDTNQTFDVLDGMMLKDGYLHKKVPIDSLSYSSITPTEDEQLKFEPSKKKEPTDVQWLSRLFGEKKKKEIKIVNDKVGGKSEGSSSATVGNTFELHDFVFIGRKDFGVVIGTEKDNSVKVLKEGLEGPSVVPCKQSELKGASFDKKLFTVLDKHSKTLSIHDSVRVLEGPLKDRQGIIKKIYKGILFLYDENEQENNGYICARAQLCEKTNVSVDMSNEKGGEPGLSATPDVLPSPKSPMSPEKHERDSKFNFKGDDNAMFFAGQSVRIRVGPLKGYRCRVLAVRRSDVTVKLDSQQRILTVKSEHVSEVREKGSLIAQGEDSGPIKPFDFLGAQDGSRDWMDGAAISTEVDKWNAGGSAERSSWSALPSSNVSIPGGSGSGNPLDDNSKEGTEDSSWQIKVTPVDNSSWGAAVVAANTNMVSGTSLIDDWGSKPAQPQQDSLNEVLKNDSWGVAAKTSTEHETWGSKPAWGQSGVSSCQETHGWGSAAGNPNQPDANSWKKGPDALDKSKQSSGDETAAANEGQWGNRSNDVKDGGSDNWGKSGGSTWGAKVNPGGSESGAWGPSAGGVTSQIEQETGGWTKTADNADNQTKSWGAGKAIEDDATGKSSWGKVESTSSWSKPDGGSSWANKPDGAGGSSWANKPDGGGGSSWGNKADGGGESSWGKSADISSWGQQNEGNKLISGGDQGFGGWKSGSMGNRNETDEGNNNWGRSKPFDGGCGSGGRRGRGRGLGRGGRDGYGRGSSFTRDESSSWNKDSQYGGSNDDAGKNSSGSNQQAGGWGTANVSDRGEASKDGESGGAWGGASRNGNSGGWNISRNSNTSNVSGWGNTANANEESGAVSSWGNETKPAEDQSSGWGSKGNWGSQKGTEEEAGNKGNWSSQKGNEEDGNKGNWGKKPNENKSSDWDKGGNQKAFEENNSWNSSGNGKNGSGGSWKDNGGSSAGWGHSNWLKNESNSSGGDNQDSSTWSSKSNWNSDNQDSTFGGDGGRGVGGWRGRGGRGDRGGYRGRGGDRGGGFGGRGGDRGRRFGGRGGDRGGVGGRDGSDRGGFHSRGGFRGRGRGDWNNRGDDSRSKDSDSDGQGWKSSGFGGGHSWNNKETDRTPSESSGQPSSWKTGTSWNDPNNEAHKNDTEPGGWGSSGGSGGVASTAGLGETGGGWGSCKSSWNDPNKDARQNNTEFGGWGSSGGSGKVASAAGLGETGGGWNSNKSSWNDPNKDARQNDTEPGGWGSSGGSGKVDSAAGLGGTGSEWNTSKSSWGTSGADTSVVIDMRGFKGSSEAAGGGDVWGKNSESSDGGKGKEEEPSGGWGGKAEKSSWGGDGIKGGW